MVDDNRGLSRRRFLAALANAAGVGAVLMLHGRRRGVPGGAGAPRHAEHRLPPGQHWIKELVDYSAGGRPAIDEAGWRLRVDGLVERPLVYDLKGFRALPHVDAVSDFHCVTSWSVRDCRWRGVRLADLLKKAEPTSEAAHVFIECYGGYSTNLPLPLAMLPDLLLADEYRRKPLPHIFGGPLRLVVPNLYAYKSAKWVHRITLLAQEKLGYWERYGYSNKADPWKEQRWARDGQ
jgi:DMSO/TMAO reductase YedYZ molybdopterin-dependent catalytic subunit